MIVKTDFTRGDGLARHLSRSDTNTRVVIREDLSQGVPLDLALAVPLLGGFAATNPRAVRRVIHAKCSPGEEHDGASRLVLNLLLERYGISPTAPRIGVQHTKPSADGTPRPDHFHFVFPLVDIETGKAIRSHDAQLKDEIVARLAELELGEAITPGVRHNEVVRQLDMEGKAEIAQELGRHAAVRGGERMTTGTRRALQRAGHDADAAASRLFEIWHAARGDVIAFVAAAGQAGFEIRAGESVVLAVHVESSVPIPLRRALNQASKAAGAALRLRREDCDDLFGDLPEQVGRQEMRDNEKLANDRDKTDEQLIWLGREALADGDGRGAARAFGAVAARRRSWEAERGIGYREIAAERRRERRRAEIVGRRRVERAFRHAAIFSDRHLRRLAFAAAAAGAVLAGGGLGAALIAGGIALAALPSYEAARAAKFVERRDLLARYRRERGALEQHRADTVATRKDQAKALNRWGDNQLAGAYFDLLAVERRRSLRYHEKQLKRALRAALRKAKVGMLDELGRRADAPAIGKALGFKPMRTDRDRRAVAQALRERRETAAADALDPTYAFIRDISMAMPAVIVSDVGADIEPVVQAGTTVSQAGGNPVPGAGGKASNAVRATSAGPGATGRSPGLGSGVRPAATRRPPQLSRGRGYGD